MRGGLVYQRCGVVLAVLVCLGSGCDNEAQREARSRYRRIPPSEGFIAFVGTGQDDPLWPVLRAGAERFDREFGWIHVRYEAPRIASAEQQMALIRSLADSKLRGLCVQAIDPEAMVPVLEYVVRKGGRIVTMMRKVPYGKIDGHVGCDEAVVGRSLADAVVRSLRSQGTVMALHAGDRDAAMRTRYNAFREAMQPFRSIELLAENDCGGDPFRARREIASLSARYPRLSAWVSPAPWPLEHWTSTGPDDSPLPPGCRLITCGAEPPMWKYIENGTCPAVVGIVCHDLGFKALEFCQGALDAPSPGGREYLAPVRVITIENLEQYKHDWSVWTASPATRP